MLLSFDKTKELLQKYDLPLVESKRVSSAEEASEVGFPLVLKIFAPEVAHRTEQNLVQTDIENEEQLQSAFEKIQTRAQEIDSAQIVAQKQAEGIELVFGMKNDETFGPVLMFGLGGIFVEVLKDVSFGITPVSKQEAREMINGIKSVKVLKGFRNKPAVDLSQAADFLVKLSDLAEQEQVEGIDFNPVFAQGKDFKIADPKIFS